jgi:hypothetical protein
VSRGRDRSGTGSIDAARRRQTRRTAAARVLRAQKERLRAAERKHTRVFLSSTIKLARRYARSTGSNVRVERDGGGRGWRSHFSWTQAVVELPPTRIVIQFNVAGKSGSGGSSAIHVRLGRRLVSPCPLDLLQSGDRGQFTKWLEEALRMASER